MSKGIPAFRDNTFSALLVCDEEEVGVEIDVEGEVMTVDLFGKLAP